MPTGNLDDPLLPIAPQTAPTRRFRLPSDYYSATLSEVRPVLPAWAPYGCGAAAGVFLILLFAGGTLMTGTRLAALLDFVIGTSLGEFRGMYTADVTSTQKDRFEAEVKRMRDDLRKGAVSAQDVQAFLKAMQKAIADKKVTGQELEQLTKTTAQVKPAIGNR